MSDVIDPVQDHGHPLDSQAKGEPCPFFRIEIDQAEDLRINHSTPHDFDPFVAQFSQIRTLEIDLETGLGEREKARAQAGLELITKQFLEKIIEYALEILDRYLPVDVQTLGLVKVGRMGRIHRIPSEASSGGDDAQGWGFAEQASDLNGTFIDQKPPDYRSSSLLPQFLLA